MKCSRERSEYWFFFKKKMIKDDLCWAEGLVTTQMYLCSFLINHWKRFANAFFPECETSLFKKKGSLSASYNAYNYKGVPYNSLRMHWMTPVRHSQTLSLCCQNGECNILQCKLHLLERLCDVQCMQQQKEGLPYKGVTLLPSIWPSFIYLCVFSLYYFYK